MKKFFLLLLIPLLIGMVLAACISQSSRSSDAVSNIRPVGTYNADVCVIGAGISGLSATVQALQNGLSVVTLEKSGSTGGGGRGTEGVFGVGSQMQKDLGITIDPVSVLKAEMGYHHNRVDGLRWLDLIRASGDNIAWLQQNGVNFTGVVDNYHGGDHETFHWFTENRAAHDYVPPMTAKAQELGAQILVNTRAEHLIVEKGAVTGVFAIKANGDYIRVNAKAVIVGTGGFANNNEYLARGHFSNVSKVQRFLYGFDGDGLRMVLEAGGADTLDRFSGLFQLTVSGAPGGEYGTFGSGNGLVVGSHSGNTLWVNQSGERFCAENTGDENWMALMIPTIVHQRAYSVFDRATFEENVRNIAFPADTFEESMAEIEERFASNPYNDAFSANTIGELAAKVSAAFPDIEAETFITTFNTYNEMCRKGADTDFGKPAKYLMELKNPPYYFIYMPQAVMVTFGGIHTNRKFECVDADEKPIPGLYAIGVDSAELWPNIYTINVPGGTNANNVHSGRAAANNARQFIGQGATGKITSSGDTSPSVVKGNWKTPAGIKDGTYTASARGMFGGITATVTVSGGKIARITQTNELETSYIGALALEELISAVISAQDVNVDTITGATQTSNGFRNAVQNCLEQAAK
jgi:fumarate reductase flavoprotein subunit